MATVTAWAAELRRLGTDAWVDYLVEHSGLPGPRANTTLAAAVAEVADARIIDELVRDGGEYPMMCAAAAVARGAAPGRDAEALRFAADDRWRVREGIALGLQLLGDADPHTLAATVRAWADEDDPLVVRAAVAAICEPRLLRSPEMAAVAVEVCARATAHLVARPQPQRHDSAARTLRQTLGYAWSVAVAADPGPGLRAFEALDTTDPDVAWIVHENARKKRLSRLL
ncbi:HEAT repeat domain-containing protein [Microbacterium sp. 2P01SA-2]|uniref:HEAT repeat domain-containing protein n=1 Tax=unclassified Microbacterium TaxID=2609290 RepID=UPI0039A34BCD